MRRVAVDTDQARPAVVPWSDNEVPLHTGGSVEHDDDDIIDRWLGSLSPAAFDRVLTDLARRDISSP
jgi:hypothetical protein